VDIVGEGGDLVVDLASGEAPEEIAGRVALGGGSKSAWIVRRVGVIGLEYDDQRDPRCVTGQIREATTCPSLWMGHAASGRSP
jgi:hypothetical protein